MTGFGKAEVSVAGVKITVETRSLNGKQLDLSVKMPSRYRPFEYEIRSRVNKVLQRGKVDMFISYELIGEQNSININESLFNAYALRFKELTAGSGLGFSTAGRNVQGNRKAVLEKAVKKVFPPEFINRVDEQIYFNSLTKENIEKIIDIELKGLKKRVKDAGFDLTVTSAAKRLTADSGYDPSYGARPLKRAIQRYIEDPVSEHIITGRMLSGKNGLNYTKIRVSLSEDKESTVVEWR